MPFPDGAGVTECISHATKWHNDAETWRCLADDAKDLVFKTNYLVIAAAYESMSQHAISKAVEVCRP